MEIIIHTYREARAEMQRLSQDSRSPDGSINDFLEKRRQFSDPNPNSVTSWNTNFRSFIFMKWESEFEFMGLLRFRQTESGAEVFLQQVHFLEVCKQSLVNRHLQRVLSLLFGIQLGLVSFCQLLKLFHIALILLLKLL
jgi:hypothetical protein